MPIFSFVETNMHPDSPQSVRFESTTPRTIQTWSPSYLQALTSTPEIEPAWSSNVRTSRTPEIEPALSSNVRTLRTPEIEPAWSSNVGTSRTLEIEPALSSNVRTLTTPEIEPAWSSNVRTSRTPEIGPALSSNVETSSTPTRNESGRRYVYNESQRPHKPKLTMEMLTRVEIMEKGVCVICFEEWCKGTAVSKLPCKHKFHLECVSKWLEIRATCPLCRYGYDSDDDDYSGSSSSESEAE